MSTNRLFFGLTVTFLFIASSSANAQHGWTWQNPRPQGNALYDVTHLTGSEWLACGEHGSLIRSSDNGATWTPQSFGRRTRILRMHFPYPDQGYLTVEGSVFHSSDGGRTWLEQINTEYTLWDIDFADAQHGIAVGSFGIILHTSDAGVTWNYLDAEIQDDLHAVVYTDAANAVITGANGILLRTSTGGLSWQKSTIGTNRRIMDITAIPGGGGSLIAVGDNGTLLRSTDGGESWTNAIHSSTSNLTRVHFTDGNNGIITGGGGTLLRSADGGKNWSNVLPGGGADLRGIATHGMTALIVAANGTVLRSSNGGMNWGGEGPVTINHLKCLSFSDASTGITAGLGVSPLWTTNGGQVWNRQAISSGSDILDICLIGGTVHAVSKGGYILRSRLDGSANTRHTVNTAIQLRGVSFIDANNGIVVGTNGTILHTDDGGDTWVKRTNEQYLHLNDVLLIDTETALAVGERGTCIRTSDGGITWSYMLVGVQEELKSISSLTDGYISIAGTQGLILRSGTLGMNWDIQRIETRPMLNGISFGNASVCVAVGELGALFVTTDGGSTWTSQPEVTRYGLNAVQMHDARSGTIVGNSGIILRTTSGGVSWLADTRRAPAQAMLGRHYPNPVSDHAVIPFTLHEAGHTTVSVHDMLGRRVALLLDTFLDSGAHSAHFDAAALPAGMYICVLRTAHGAVSSMLPVFGPGAVR
ncbi:MAG: YCF48-related protein [Bacteroidia bacterium]|nr:YCF48-related protein [Bacteroidia bacterium]